MSDTISRQAAIDAIENAFDRETILNRFVRKIAISAVRTLPSAQPERKKGKWILECDAEGEGDNLYRCPECGCNYSCQEYDIPNFCPNCGADMRGENYDKG